MEMVSSWNCIRSSSDEDILVSSGRPFRFVWETWMEMVSSDDEETWKSSSSGRLGWKWFRLMCT